MCNIQLPACLCTNATKSSSYTYGRFFLKKPKSHVYCSCVQDDTALLFLGQCFESGFGVQQNLRTAIEYYKRAARAGNKQAKSILTPPNGTDSKGKHTFVWVIGICAFVSNGTALNELLMSQDNSDNMLSLLPASPLQQKTLCCAPSVLLRLSLELTIDPSSPCLLWSVLCLTPGAPGACVCPRRCPSRPFTSIPTALREEPASGL